MQGILCKPGEATPEPPAPIRAHRQAAWEKILHLKAGDLSPARVKVRARQRELYAAQEILKEFEESTSHEKQAIATVELLLERTLLRTTRKKGV